MPVSAHFDGRLLWIEFSGEIDNTLLDDVALLTRQVEDQLHPTPHRIVNLSRVTHFNLRFGGIFALAQRRQARAFSNAFRSALVAPEHVHLGFARMYQTVLNHPQIEVQVFQTVPQALAWLDEMKIEGQDQAARAQE
ncbi:MAG: hypothetical protein KIS92_02855 [Planctomycetota bacterium]|nr:hypothetical protein [Planctomycetota bacterium]